MKRTRSTVVCTAALLLMTASLPSSAQLFEDRQEASRDLAHQIAGAYSIEQWHKLDVVEFTFNARLPGREKPVVRAWSWDKTTGEITVTLPDEAPFTYRRDDVKPNTPQAQADQWFINDTYWLLFPFQIVWADPPPMLTDHGQAPMPIGTEVAFKKVTVQYPAQGGYTPGDAYDLYLDEQMLIRQWVFRRGGGKEGRPATWESNVRLGPVLLSLDHQGPDGKFKLWFTDVRARLAGQSDWTQPVKAAPPKAPTKPE